MSASLFKFFDTPRGLSLGMATLQLFKGCASIILVMIAANMFGAGIDRDSWVIGWSVQILVFKLIFGPINEVFRAQFLEIKEKFGTASASNSALVLLLAMSIFGIIICLTFYFNQSILLQIFAPGYKSEASNSLVIKMIIALIPTIILSELVVIGVAILNSFKSFYLPEFFGLFSILLNIIFLFFLGKHIGILSLVYANYLSLVLFVITLCVLLFRKGFFISKIYLKIKLIRPYFILALPVYVTYFFSQGNAWLEKYLVSYLGVGNTSALDYARKFIDMPITIVISIGATVMTPLLASYWLSNKNDNNFQYNFLLYIRMGLIILSPIILLYTLCATELVELLLHRGTFDATWVKPTANTLVWFGIGLIGVVFYSLSSQVLLLQKKAKLYASIAIVSQLIPVCINYIFYEQVGLTIFGMSWCITQCVSGFILFAFTGTHNRQYLMDLAKLFLVLICAFFICYIVLYIFNEVTTVLKLSLISLTYLAILTVFFQIFKFEEHTALKKMFLKK